MITYGPVMDQLDKRIAAYKYRLETAIPIPESEMIAIIKDLASAWPRYPDQNTASDSQADRTLMLRQMRYLWYFWVRVHLLNLNNGSRTNLKMYYQLADVIPFGEYLEAIEKLIKLGKLSPYQTQAQYQELARVGYPSIKEGWVLQLDAMDLATWQQELRRLKSVATSDNWVLGIRADVFSAATEVVVATGLAVLGGAAIYGAATSGAGAAGAIQGSAFEASTYAGTTLTATEYGAVSTFSAAEIAGVGAGITATEVAATTGIVATLESLLPKGALDAASASLTSGLTGAIKDFLQPKAGDNSTISDVVSNNKNGLAIAAALAAGILLLI